MRCSSSCRGCSAGEEVFDKAANLFDDAKTEYILSYLRSIYHDLAALGMKEKISVDLGIINRNDYYTGVVFRGYIEGFGETVLSGGRYDTLLSEFGADLPATGFGVNVDAVARSLLKSSGYCGQSARCAGLWRRRL